MPKKLGSLAAVRAGLEALVDATIERVDAWEEGSYNGMRCMLHTSKGQIHFYWGTNGMRIDLKESLTAVVAAEEAPR